MLLSQIRTLAETARSSCVCGSCPRLARQSLQSQARPVDGCKTYDSAATESAAAHSHTASLFPICIRGLRAVVREMMRLTNLT